GKLTKFLRLLSADTIDQRIIINIVVVQKDQFSQSIVVQIRQKSAALTVCHGELRLKLRPAFHPLLGNLLGNLLGCTAVLCVRSLLILRFGRLCLLFGCFLCCLSLLGRISCFLLLCGRTAKQAPRCHHCKQQRQPFFCMFSHAIFLHFLQRALF